MWQMQWLCPFCVGSEVLTAVVMKSSIFWNITPCSPLKVNSCLEGIHGVNRPLLQDNSSCHCLFANSKDL
jgi:hypothetical protein